MSVQWKTGDPAGAELADHNGAGSEPSASHPPGSLITIRYLWNAVRRHVRLWLSVTLVGLTAGMLFPVLMPPAGEASVTLLVTHRDGDDPSRAILTDISLLSSLRVAEATAAALDLPESPHDLRDRYTVTQLTVRVIEVRANAPSNAEATALAETLSDVFLDFRTEQVAAQELPLHAELETADGHVEEAAAAVRAAGGNPNDPDPPRTETSIKLAEARERQQFIEQQILDQQVQQARMNSSRVLDSAAPVPRSEGFTMAISAASGLAGGFVVGLGFVLVRAILSDRVWRRQDIARAVGASVALSIGRSPFWRWRPSPRYLRHSAFRQPEAQQVVAHLRKSVPWTGDTKPSLTVVAVDNAKHSAIMVASLAVAFAEDGKRVLAADLTGTGALGAAFGVKEPGVHESRLEDHEPTVTVYQSDPQTSPANPGGPHDAGDLELAWLGADIVLTLASVPPAVGAEHIRPWSSHTAAIVTAGRASATTLEATGDLIRLAGLHLDTVVLLGADPIDDSIGVPAGNAAVVQMRQ